MKCHGQKLKYSEYQERHFRQPLVGRLQAMWGMMKVDKLTEAVLEDLLSVVLLDEIEKAHPDYLTSVAGT